MLPFRVGRFLVVKEPVSECDGEGDTCQPRSPLAAGKPLQRMGTGPHKGPGAAAVAAAAAASRARLDLHPFLDRKTAEDGKADSGAALHRLRASAPSLAQAGAPAAETPALLLRGLGARRGYQRSTVCQPKAGAQVGRCGEQAEGPAPTPAAAPLLAAPLAAVAAASAAMAPASWPAAAPAATAAAQKAEAAAAARARTRAVGSVASPVRQRGGGYN